MKPEAVFGINAGKVWDTLKSNGPLSADAIAKATKLKAKDVFGALGWLGREGKIEIVSEKNNHQYKLV